MGFKIGEDDRFLPRLINKLQPNFTLDRIDHRVHLFNKVEPPLTRHSGFSGLIEILYEFWGIDLHGLVKLVLLASILRSPGFAFSGTRQQNYHRQY